jgi:hypothetical protein
MLDLLELLELFFASWRSYAVNLAWKWRRKKGRTREQMWLQNFGICHEFSTSDPESRSFATEEKTANHRANEEATEA